jgi:hypothetical protein
VTDSIPLFPSQDAYNLNLYARLSDFLHEVIKPLPVSSDMIAFGDIIRFSYDGKIRQVFVLHPNFKEKMHVLDLQLVPPTVAVRQLIPVVKHDQDPYSFYHNHAEIKDFVKEWDCYRTFFANKVLNLSKYFNR